MIVGTKLLRKPNMISDKKLMTKKFKQIYIEKLGDNCRKLGYDSETASKIADKNPLIETQFDFQCFYYGYIHGCTDFRDYTY